MLEWFEIDIVILIIYILLLLVGLFLCLKQRLMIAFTFFLLFLFSKLINIYFIRYTKLMIDGEIPKPENIDVDQLLNVVKQATQFIELLAFVILFIGLYKRGKRRQKSN